jgi:hypothetical protein
MAITNYNGLIVKLGRWMNRGDLDSIYPDFIALAEERIYRLLRVRQMEATLSATAIANGLIALPASMVGIKTLWLDGYEESPLLPQTYEFVLSHDSGGLATHWALAGDGIYFNGTGTVEGVIYESVPELSETDSTNWLLTAHPSLYLFGSLMEAHLYIKDQEQAQMWEARFGRAIDEVMGADKRDMLNGPLQARAR